MRLRTVSSAAALTLAAGYAFTQLRFLRAWRRVPAATATAPEGDLHPHPDPDPDPSSNHAPRWSVIIPARNEADALAACLTALARQDVPAAQYEVIIVDDASTDATRAVAAGFAAERLRVLPAVGTGKKAALHTGIAAARAPWIVTLDADVCVPPTWLRALDAARRVPTITRAPVAVAAAVAVAAPVAIAGPVALAPAHSRFARFQALDFYGMMLITGATLRLGQWAMGNGANLAFARAAFEAVGGYATPGDQRPVVSGDDMVLLGKLAARFPARVAFAKTRAAVVETPPQPTLAAFVRQRRRWAAKTGLNQQPALTATLAGVWAFHVGLLLGVPLALAGGLPRRVLALAWATKVTVDYALLGEATDFFRRRDLLSCDYPALAVAHTLYVAGVGTLALLPLEFEWKGRRSRY